MFSDEELEDAVLSFLTSDVETARSEFGTRDIVTARAQVYEIISAAFMLRPQAVFSVIWMASNAITRELRAQRADLAEVIAAAPRVSKVSIRVETTTDLHNAEASLVSLTAAFSARSAGVAGGIGPAIERFDASLNRFMRMELAKNTVVAGDVVKTPEELRLDVAKLWARMRARHIALDARLARFADVFTDYAQVRLPDTVVGSLLVRMQTRLATITDAMRQTDAPARSRDALLQLAAMRTLLAQASRFRPPVANKSPLPGDAQSGSLTGESGHSAGILGSVSGPFNYASGSTLTYSVGSVARTVTLPGATNVPVDDVVLALRADAALVADKVVTAHAPVAGQRSGASGEANVLLTRVAAGTGLVVVDGVGTAPKDLAGLGVDVGMVAVLSGPLSAEAVIASVDGPRITFANALLPGTYDYYIGPDFRDMPVGTAVYLTGSVDAGTYRLVQGGVARVTVDRALATPLAVRVLVVSERLRIAARAVSAFTTLVVPSSAAAIALGVIGNEQPLLEWFDSKIDLGARGVVPGDELSLEGPANVYQTFRIEEVDGTLLRFSPPQPYRAGNWRYQIRDGLMTSYQLQRTNVRFELLSDDFSNVTRLDEIMGRLSRGARYSADFALALTEYDESLARLLTQLEAYTVPRDRTVEQAVRVMVEHGFDRAVDFFLGLRLREFFALDADGVSYKTWVIRSAAEVARQVVPVTKDTRDPTSGWQTVAVQPAVDGEK